MTPIKRNKNPAGDFKKSVVRIDLDDWKRLDAIRAQYKFKSIYEIMQYLVGAFLRVADPEHEENDDPIPDEITEMFSDFAQAERQFNYSKPKRALPQHVKDEKNGQLRFKF